MAGRKGQRRMEGGKVKEQAEEKKRAQIREGSGTANSVPSSASSSSGTPVSWHFLLWAFDFMCLVRFPGKKWKETQVSWRASGRFGVSRGGSWRAGCVLPAQRRSCQLEGLRSAQVFGLGHYR